MVDKSKEFLNTFNSWTTDGEKVKRNYEHFIKNRSSEDLLFYNNLNKINKERVISFHDNKCVICGTKHRSKLEIHHIIPKSEGGTNEIGNLIPLCHICHCMVHKIDVLNPYGMAMLKRVVSKVGEIA